MLHLWPVNIHVFQMLIVCGSPSVHDCWYCSG